jgi:cystathionine beta-lyase
MSQNELDRRSFLRNAGVAAVAGAVSGVSPLAAAAAPKTAEPAPGRFDFDTPLNRFGTDCVKFDQQIRLFGKDSVQVGMGIADMDFRAAPVITKALRDRLQHENWGYIDEVKSQADMAEAIVAWNKRHYGVDIDPGSISLATGVHPGLVAAIQTFSPRGSRVLLQTPAYDGFYSDLRFTGTLPEESPLKLQNGRFSMDFEDFERRISHETNTFILCNPHNPTGNCWSPEDLLRIGEICLRRRVVLLADEIHCDFVTRGNKYTPFATLKNKDVVDNSISFKAASKSFGLAAHKVGWFYSTNPELVARVRTNLRADLSTLGLVANRAALTGGDEWLEQVVQYIDGNHDFAQDYLASRVPLIRARKPEGTYLVWLDVSQIAERIDSAQMARDYNKAKPAGLPDKTPEHMVERFLVQNARVQMNAGSNYGLGGSNHMRMNVATSRKQLELGLGNVAAALRNL